MILLYCATKNAGKLREFQQAADEGLPGQVTIQVLPGLATLPTPDEHGDTFEANAALKAMEYSGAVDGYVFADDSGLAVDALNGAPGVQSAHFAGEHAGDEANNRLLLEKLRNEPDRSARYVCVIALARHGKLLGTWRGETDGRIQDDARGANGFGYDPYFYSPALGCTFAEASTSAKWQVSHRGAAMRELLKALPALVESA